MDLDSISDMLFISSYAFAIVGAFLLIGGGGVLTLAFIMGIAEMWFLPMTNLHISEVLFIAIGLLTLGGILTGLSHGGN